MQGSYFNTLRIIHLAMLMGQVMLVVLSYLLFLKDAEFALNTDNMIFFIVPILVISLISASFMVYKKLISKLNIEPDFNLRLNQYRVANLVRWAMIEGGTLASVILSIAYKNLLFMPFAGLLIVVFVLLGTSKAKMAREVEFTQEELNQLEFV